MNQRGFTLVEALIGIGILEVGIFAALFLSQNIAVLNRGSDDDLTYLTVRNQILVTITDPRIWSYTLNGALNPGMACWLKQDQVPLASRNCSGKSGSLVVYNIKKAEEFNFIEPNAGLTPRGDKCTTFVAPPAAGNPQCPIGLQLNWKAICNPADPACVNPPVQVDAVFTYNGAKTQHAPPPHRLNFSVFRYLHYCPAQTPGWVLQDGGVPTTTTIASGNQVISGDTGKVATTGFGTMYIGAAPALFNPCRTVSANYQEDMDTTPTAPANVNDAENESQVCLYDEDTSQCHIDVVRRVVAGVRTISVRYDGVVLAQLPAYSNISSTSVLTLRVNRNLAELLVDNRVFYTWKQKVVYPFEVRFRPASKSYSPGGFKFISITTLN